MKQIYDTGATENSIFMEVTVGTAGTAYTSVYLTKSDGQRDKLGESDADSGNVKEMRIGTGIELRRTWLQILTFIDFILVDEKNQDNAMNKFLIRYILHGGFSGHQTYVHDPDDVIVMPNGKVLVTKSIELK
ncbi:MAG: hypothetical protein PHX54_04645 [Lentimicrobiaceae bacterium]|nr:hypothetical protein [Lentimicrobiaceae bacterium]